MERNNTYHKVFDRFYKKYVNIGNSLFSNSRRKKLKSVDFSIISNNCWAGSVYRRYGLPYSSPTVGLYFYAAEYIKFLQNLKENLKGDVRIISLSESKYADDIIKKGQENVLIGMINDNVEVVFLHYHDPKEAIEKWRRRAERVNYDKLVVKFSEMNNCSEKEIDAFVTLPFKHKILLTSSLRTGVPYCYVVKRYTKGDSVKDDTTYYSSFFDLDGYFSKL